MISTAYPPIARKASLPPATVNADAWKCAFLNSIGPVFAYLRSPAFIPAALASSQSTRTSCSFESQKASCPVIPAPSHPRYPRCCGSLRAIAIPRAAGQSPLADDGIFQHCRFRLAARSLDCGADRGALIRLHRKHQPAHGLRQPARLPGSRSARINVAGNLHHIVPRSSIAP